MKITKVEPIVLNVPLDAPVETSFGTMTSRTSVLVKVEANTGVYGIGEIWNNFPSWGVYEKLSTLKYGITPLLIGEDPRNVEAINDKLIQSCTVLGLQWGALGPIYQCISGIDIALWDLVGRDSGKSISELLGGKITKEVDVYASGLGPGHFADLVKQHQALGITHFKLKVGKDAEQDKMNLAQMKHLLRPNDRLMIDANQAWNQQTAIEQLNQFKAHNNLVWIEEPIRCDALDDMRLVREQTGIPVAAGENLYGVDDAKIALEKKALDIIQPDLSKNGGITQAKKMVEVAAQNEIPFAPHFLGGAVCLAASIHFIASIEGGQLLEFDANPNPFREKLFTEPFKINNGKIQVPNAPGLGFELDQAFVDYYKLDASVLVN